MTRLAVPVSAAAVHMLDCHLPMIIRRQPSAQTAKQDMHSTVPTPSSGTL